MGQAWGASISSLEDGGEREQVSGCGWLSGCVVVHVINCCMCRSDLIDKLHNYAFHTARCGHQTQYTKILMMRAMNRCKQLMWPATTSLWWCLLLRYCVHWRLMMHLHIHRTVCNGTEGSCFPYDLDAEHANKYTVAWNKAHSSFSETVEFTGQVQAYQHVDRTYRKLTHQEIETPLEERPSFMAGALTHSPNHSLTHPCGPHICRGDLPSSVIRAADSTTPPPKLSQCIHGQDRWEGLEAPQL